MISINFIREIVYVTLLVVSVFATIIIYLDRKNKKESNRLDEYNININAQIDESIPNLLDLIITECFQEYIVLNIEYKDILYVDDELQTRIMREVADMVARRISPAILSKLSLYYNVNAMSDIISDKVYLVVLNYAIEKNEVSPDE